MTSRKTVRKSNLCIPLEEFIVEGLSKEESDPDCFRPICLKSGVFANAKGAAYAEFGGMRVLAQVNGPRESTNGDFHSGILKVVIKGIGEDEVKYRAQLVSIFSSMVQLAKYAKSEIEVEISVLARDGGMLQTAIMAGSLALVHAGVELFDVCLACHILVTSEGKYIVDPNQDSAPDVKAEITVALLANINQVVCCDVRGALTMREQNAAVDFALDRCQRLYPSFRKAIVNSLEPLKI